MRRAAKRLENVRIRIPKEGLGGVVSVLFGTLMMAVGYNLFFTPAGMVPGGFTGLSIVIRRLTDGIWKGGLPVWLGSILLNVPLLIAAGFVRGRRFAAKTVAASLSLSAWIFILPERSACPDDLLLTAVFGGIFMGIGLGTVFSAGTTTGGTDTLASLLQRLVPYVPTAAIVPVLDGLVIGGSALVFGLKVSLYAVISVIVSGQISDRLVRGVKNAYAAWIVSDRRKEIAEAVINELGRGATAVPGYGMYGRQDRKILLCAVPKKQVSALKDVVYREDPNAFMIVSDCHEIRGEGFAGFADADL